jgi:Uma2 family endonuclease
MAMPALTTPHRWTVEEVLALPADGNRYEVVDGELLVSPAPRLDHQRVAGRLFIAITNYLAPVGLADCALFSPADITWGRHPKDADQLVQPDIFVIHPDDRASNWVDVARLVLVAEVVSPSSTRADRVVKRRAYQQHGVETYWVVDPDAQLVEVWHPDDERPAVLTDTLTWRWRDAEELRIALSDLFAGPNTGGNP